MQFLHSHPWRSVREIAEGMGLPTWTVNSAVARLLRHGAIIRQIRGRHVESKGRSCFTRKIVCYAIAPVSLKSELDPNVSVTPLTDSIVQVLREKGGWLTNAELRAEIPGVAMNAMNHGLETLIRNGAILKDKEWRWVRVEFPNSRKAAQMRHVELNIYTLIQGETN